MAKRTLTFWKNTPPATGPVILGAETVPVFADTDRAMTCLESSYHPAQKYLQARRAVVVDEPLAMTGRSLSSLGEVRKKIKSLGEAMS